MLEVNAKQYAHKGNKQIVERGFQYFTYGKIIDYSYDDKSKRFTFIIEGNSNYKVALKLNDDRSNIIASACSCPYDNKLCKHEIAAAFWLSENASNKEIFKKSKSIFSRGTKVTIKNARNLSHYKLTELLDQQRIRNDEDSNIENFIITELSNNKFDIFLELLVGHYFNQRAEEQNLFISRDKDHLKVECSCSERVQSNKVCSHVFLFFEKVINDQAMNIFFNSEIDKETEEKLYELVEQFGFDKSKGWKEYFEVAYSGFEKAFQLNKKYENYLNISALSRIEPKEILYSNYEEELNELENSLPSQKLQFGFYLHFNSYNLNVTINAFTGRSNKQGVPMSISYRPHNSYDWRNSKFLSSSEELIIQYAEKVNSEENIQSTLKYLNKALAILENHPYVFLNEGTNPNHFYKSDLKKIDLVIGAPQIVYGLESKNNKVVSSVKVVSNRKKYSISDKEVVRLHPHFVKIKECIYFLPNIVESSHFEAAQLVHNKIMVLSKMPDFIEKYLLNVLKKYDFEVSKNSPIKVKNKELKMKQKELYLSEVGGFIVFRPFIQYENDIRLNALTEKSEWTYKDKKLIQKKGDEVEVEEFKSLIKSLHPEFEQQLRSDYLHLRGTELLKNNMFFDFFKKLKEHNVKVFGLEKLSQLKVNPYPGKVSYSVKSGIDWFEVEASVVFGDAEISIEDLKKRFVPGSSYVELNDGTKGMLPDEWVKKLEKLFRHGNLKEGRIKISNKKFNLIDELFEELDDELSAEIFEKKEKLIHFNGFKEQKVPKGIKAELRDYQKAGYSWLNFLKDFGWGGILADDMGWENLASNYIHKANNCNRQNS